MANDVTTFVPSGNTVIIAATTSSGSVTLPAGAALAGINVRVYNDGPSLAFIKIGTGSAMASVSALPAAVRRRPRPGALREAFTF